MDEYNFMADSPLLWGAVANHKPLGDCLLRLKARLDAEGASVLLLGRGEMRFCMAIGLNAPALTGNGQWESAMRIPMSHERGINPAAALMGKSICMQEMDGRHNGDIDKALGQKTQSILAVPIIVGEQIVGTLSVINPHANAATEERYRFTGDDLAAGDHTGATISRLMDTLLKQDMQ